MGLRGSAPNTVTPGARHALIFMVVFAALFAVSVGTSLLLGAKSRGVDASVDGSYLSEPGPNELRPTETSPDPGGESAGDSTDASSGAAGGEIESTGTAGGEAAPPKPAFDPSGPILAVVIDDWGYAWAAASDFLSLDVPLTMAVIPYLPFSARQATQAAAGGHQVILHLPMEPESEQWDLGRGAVTTAMADDEIVRDVRSAYASIPFVSGINNHMGSRATADPRVMEAVLTVVKEHDTFFLDSRTTAQSVVRLVAEDLDVRVLQNDRFIDPDTEWTRVRDRLISAADIATRRGYAIVIGHVHVPTYRGLVAALPYLEDAGVRLVRLDEVLARVYDGDVPP